MGFFSDIFGRAEVRRLETENAFLREQLSEVRAEKRDLALRVENEIAVNRRREDDLVMVALRAAGIDRKPIGRDFALTEGTEQSADTSAPADAEGVPTEEQIRTIADQFVESAFTRGAIYTEEDYAILCSRIRQNPTQYGL
jgi:hypothetical protein